MMGTNYYLTEKACPTCGRGDQLHIGKSSAGWCFTLHVDPDDEDHPQTLEEWEVLFREGSSTIEDEYGSDVAPDEMSDVIRNRASLHIDREFDPKTLSENSAVPGPNGLFRHRVDQWHCVSHGAGTWDYCKGEFS